MPTLDFVFLRVPERDRSPAFFSYPVLVCACASKRYNSFITSAPFFTATGQPP